MNNISFFRELFQKSEASGSKSTVLQPLIWLTAILLSGLITSIYANAQKWVTILLSILLVISIIVYICSYIYCLLKDRDAIRSERYSIQKLAIEKGIYGDSTSGIFTNNEATQISQQQTNLLNPIENQE